MDFGFPSSNSSTEPLRSFSQENILKDCAADFMDNLTTLSSVSASDFITVDLSSFKQSCMNVYVSMMESTNARYVGTGIVAAVVICGAWKAGASWNNNTSSAGSADSLGEVGTSLMKKVKRHDISRRRDFGDPAAYKPISSYSVEQCTGPTTQTVSGRPSQTTSSGPEELVAMSETFQRQLKDAMSKLDDVKFRLKELENDKDLLTAEMEVRKQMIHKLQDENSSEREKRQQAELKMEMMNIDNMQIRQLRKEIAVKSGQLERLERLMREKDDIQMKLFSDNVVLPRCVVEARAHEFGELQNRVHQLQAEIDSTRRFREFDLECQPFRLANSVWLEDGSLALPASHVSEISVTSKKSCPTETTVAIPETVATELPNTTLQLSDKSPTFNQQMPISEEKTSNISMSMKSTSFIVPNKTSPDEKCVYRPMDNQAGINLFTTSNSAKTEDLTSTPRTIHHNNSGVFAQIRTLIGGCRDSRLDCDPANLALLKDLGTLLNGSRPNSNHAQKGQTSVSDENSKIFAFPSGGSDGSDTDPNRSQYTSVRKYQKKSLPLKRLSRYRRDKRKDNISMKRRLAVQYFGGQARLIGLGESHAPSAVSCEQSHSGLGKQYHHSDKGENNTQISANGITDRKNSNLLSIKDCEGNSSQNGDSWILIIPKDNKME